MLRHALRGLDASLMAQEPKLKDCIDVFSPKRDTVSPQNHHCHRDYGTPLNFGVPEKSQISVFNVQWNRFECSNPCLDGPFKRSDLGRTYRPALHWRFLSYLTGWGRFLGFRVVVLWVTHFLRRNCDAAGSLSDGQTWQIPNSLLSGSQGQVSYPARQKTQHTKSVENGLNSTVQASILARLLKGTYWIIGTGQQIQRIPYVFLCSHIKISWCHVVQGILWYSD